MKENFHSQKGLTLIEILLSIVILGIILTSIMGFFTQSAAFTQKNGQKLQTVQTAQKFINLVKDNIFLNDLAANNTTKAVTTTSGTTISINKTVIDQLIKSTYASNYTISAVVTNNNTPSNLIQFKIIVQDPNNSSNKSETYTYIRK